MNEVMPAAVHVSLSVKIIVRDDSGRVLVLQRSRASKGNPGKWEFPGGKVNVDETLAAALVREVREETGLEITLKESFGTCEAKLGDRRIVYLVMEAVAITKEVQLSGEHDRYQWIAPTDFGDLDFSPQFHRLARRYAQDVAANPREITVQSGKKPDAEDLFKDSVVNPRKLRTDLQRFRSQKKRLSDFSEFLEKFLASSVKAVVPMAEVSARPKEPASFAGKLIKKGKYTDPLRQVTDLAGARVIVHLHSEVAVVCRWIEETFEIDRANSGDKLKELGADKFGYRSVHYVVEMREKKPAGLPPHLIGLKAEIQVRTIAQHAWSDIGHDRVYKCDCEIPDYWRREANRISALLEAADEEFARLVKGIAAYQDHVKQCPDDQTARRQIELWDAVRRELPQHPVPALRVVRLALERQDWSKAVEVVDAFKGNLGAELLCAKGYALCRASGGPKGRGWKRGIALLAKASRESRDKIEPLLRLGELLAPHAHKKALLWYERAFERDPSNPAALVGYIRHKVLEQRSVAFIPLLRPDIEAAIKRSEELAAAGADLPHAFYRIAGFLMLLGPGRRQESLAMLARAVHQTRTNASRPLIQALIDISALARLERSRPDIECARRFLAAAFLARCPGETWPAGVARPAMKPIKPRGAVVMVAGGCDAYHDQSMREYGPLLEEAFAGFEGTIICGGTIEGISGVVGQLAANSLRRIEAVGYLPRRLPTDGTATKDNRYRLRRTDLENKFTAIEPIQSWLDLMAGGVDPKAVRLLGINGGNVAGLEYRIAVALGAWVGVIQGSGREAERVANDWPAIPNAGSSGRLLVLPRDSMTLRAFLRVGFAREHSIPESVKERAAILTHQMFLEEQRYKHPNPVMQPWSKLREDLRNSNRDQITHLVTILRSKGFGVRPAEGFPRDPKFTKDEIEEMGEKEHGRWNVERLASGWKYAEVKDADKKLSPFLVPWEKLDTPIQEYDLQNVRSWPQILAEVGYEIYRLS